MLVLSEEISKITQRIVEGFNPEKIILFGSYAYGQATPNSDVDLLIILSFEGRSFYKSLEILDRVDPRFPIDLIVRRPEEVIRRYEEGDPLIREALEHGKVLYERNN